MPRMKKEADITAPNEYMLRLLGDIPLDEVAGVALESAAAIQFCNAIGLSASEQKTFMTDKKTLTFEALEQYVPIDVRLSDEYSVTLQEVFEMPESTFDSLYVVYKNLIKDCKADVAVAIFDNRSSGKYRGLAIMRADWLRIENVQNTCVVRRNVKRQITLIAGRPIDIFTALRKSRILRAAWRIRLDNTIDEDDNNCEFEE